MRLLLDTHIALWATLDSKRLSQRAHAMITEADEVIVSVMSLWEIAIKYARRKGQPNDIPLSAAQARLIFAEAGYAVLPVMDAHATAIDDLPPHHRDPFDRMLIAQALTEPLRLLTADRALAVYGSMVVLV